MKVRKLLWWAYLTVLHLAILLVLFVLMPQVRHRFQMEKRLPGSRLSTRYDNRTDEWTRFIMHDGRDPVLAITDRPFGVDHILVAPPGSRFVWSFDREQGQDWKLFVAEYDTIEQADKHLQNPQSNHVLIDGYPGGGLDGFPDREAIIEDGLKRVYLIDPKTTTFKYEVPFSDEP